MNIKELKRLWEENGFRPKKKLGQNFLVDKNARDNIMRAADYGSGDTVLEIGAGFGVMTMEIAARCSVLHAVEKDKGICGIMEPVFREMDNLDLISGDILEVDVCALTVNSGKLRVFGNIPYYITTPVIERMIAQRRCVRDIHLVIQEEFADRITSPPGSKHYGSVSCFVQFYTKAKKVLRISKNSFYPKPKVDSCLLRLEVLPEPSVQVEDEGLMFSLIRKAFSQRRKKIVNTISHGGFLSMDRDAWRQVLSESGIDPSLRAEDIYLADYARLADLVLNR